MKRMNVLLNLLEIINNRKGMLILCLITSIFGVNDAWGSNYTATVEATISGGSGKVYVSKENTDPGESSYKETTDGTGNTGNDNGEYTNYLYCAPSTGYHFVNWTGNAPDNKATLTLFNPTQQKGASVYVKLGEKKPKTFKVNANVAINTYTIAFDGNGNTDGSMSDQEFKYDVAQNLTDIGFKKEFTVTFNANGGITDNNTLTSSAPFLGWATSANGSVIYSNQQSVNNLTATQGATVNLYAKWGDYPSIELPDATKSGKVLVGWSDGNTTRIAGEKYTPTANITMDAVWQDKYPFTMSCNVNALKVEEEKASAFTFTYFSNPVPHIADASIVSFDAATNTLKGLKEGTTTIYFTQEATPTIQAGTSDTYTITVSKIDNTLTADATHSMKVGDVWDGVLSNNESKGEITTETADGTLAYYDVTNNKIVAQNTGNQSFNSNEVEITIKQAATYKYTAAEKTIKVTVNKWDNTLAWTGPSSMVWWSEQASVQASGNSDATISYSVVDERYGSYDAENHVLYSHNNDGQLQVTATQAETYKYKGSSTTLTVNVSKANNHVPFTINSSTAYNNQQPSHGGSGKVSWSDGISFEQGGAGFNWDDNYVDLSFTGIPDKLSFTTSLQLAASDPYFYVKEYVNNGWSGEKWSSSQASSSTVTVPLSPNATKIRLCYSGNLSATFKNITVSELRTFSTDKSELDFGSNKKDVACIAQTFTFNYANVGHKVSLTTNDPQFIVEPSSITNIGGEQYGSQTITVTYKTDKVHTASNAKLTIADELGHSKEITLKGSTTKKIQTITWNAPYNVAEPTIPIGKTISNAASAGSNLPIIYKSLDESIIEILNNGAAFCAKELGSASIVAIQAGNDEWAEVSDTVVFKATNKGIQVISWNQSFTRLLTSTTSIPLTARVEIEDPSTGEHTYNKERSDMLVYTSGDNNVISINEHTLNIVAKGKTTITATIAGDADYEGTSVTIPVVVRDPSTGCEDVLIPTDLTSEYEFYHFSYTSDMEKIVKIDRSSSSLPGKMTFQHKGEKWGLNYSGDIEIYESTDNGKTFPTYLGKVSPSVGNYQQSQEFSLSRNATHIRFFRYKHATGYHYIKDIEILPAQFIEVSSETIDFGDVTVNSIEEQTVTINYGNAKSDFTITNTNAETKSSLAFTPDVINIEDCGETSHQSIKFTFNPKSVGPFNTSILINDLISGKSTTITIKANVIQSSQHITWEPTQTEYRTIDQIELNATASSLNAVKYYVYEGKDVADFTDGVLTIKKDGKVTIRAYEPGDALWAAAADVDKIFTIRKTNLHFDPLPIAATITYPQVLSESALTNGVVKDEDGKVVAGTIAWTNSTAKLNAGENQSQGITFMPSANPAWYNALSSSVSVTVLKATPDATASAGEIVYGAKVESSVLTNTGTTKGTWTWNDEQNEQVLAVGTYEGLKVHFTPTDQTNYNEKDGTVSLTVTAATPTLEWTAKAETAQVHETKTFTASSTNTDNTAAITYSIISGNDCATIDASTGEVTVLKAGTITVQASQAATTNFNAATSITTTCTISTAPTEITTEPQIDGDIVYGAQLTDLKLKANTCAARNTVNQQSVEGTFAITSGDISTAGEHSVTVTFTPANTDMYAPCTKDISVTVQKANPDATPKAGDIAYGQKVNESTLTNEGATKGTWTWTEDEKDKVLAVGTYEGLKVHFTPTDPTNYNEIDGTVSLTVNKAAATLSWTSAPTEADVKDQLTYQATSNHSESAITYAITEGNDYATIDANTGVLTIIKAGTITVQASQAATAHYEADNLSITTTLTGEFETVFIGNGDWNDENNWTHGLPTSSNPDVVISGNMTIDEPISVGSLTIEANGSVTIIVEGDLTVNGKSKERDAYGDLFVHNGGNVTIGSEASVTVHDFVIEASIGTQGGASVSGQVDNGDKVIYTNGAYIDIHMDPKGSMDDTQWYGFTVPFQVNVQNGVSRKEGETFRKCTYGSDYMIAEYDMNQRLNTGNGWKYIKSGELQPGHFYFFTVNGSYNTYRFKAAKNVITIENQTTLTTNGTGANANWNAVGNTTLTYATISGNDLPNYVQTYINGQSSYQVVHTQDAQFVVGCPFFFQATKNNTTMVLSKPTGTTSAHYAPRQTDRPICVRIAEDGKGFSDQMYITASEDAQGQYQMGRDLAKAGVGTKSAQLWINAYNQQLCVNDAPLVANQAFYDMSLFIPKAGNYEISLPTTPTNGTLYLTQDGYPIWNLNDAPYVLESGKGTISEYGLMFEATQAAAPTDVQTISGNDNAQKILKEQSIYIYKNGNIFNVTGQKVK